MGYGLKIKKPSYAKDTEVHVIDNIPEVLLRADGTAAVTVKEGDRVLAGQPIANTPSDCTPLYSSISGEVVGITASDDATFIKIANDGKYESAPSPVRTDVRLSQMSREDMVERIRLCAIPIWKKLRDGDSIGHLVLDCLDREPYCSDVKCAVRNHAHEIIGGVKILLKLLALGSCEIIIEKGNASAVNALLEYIGESTLFGLTETDGIHRAGERERQLGALPSLSSVPEEKLCVIDVHTAAAIYQAFSKGTPYLRRLVSVGGASVSGGCYDLPLGTPIAVIADQTIKKASADSQKLLCISDGAMTGRLIDTEASVIDGSTHSLVFCAEDELCTRTGTCIGCGKCDRACPDRLTPSLFIRTYETDHASALKASGMDRCTACGACSYVCPARIPIHEVAQGDTDLLRPDKKYKKRPLSSAPFIRRADTSRGMNLDLIFALCALVGWAVCKFGIFSLIICATSVLCAVGADIVYSILSKNGARSVLDLGSVVCGLSCSLVMSINTPLYAVALASFFAVMIVRGIFGGAGRNMIHSAFCARILVSMFWHGAFVYNSGRNYTMFDYLLGNTEGALGEVSVIILTACALYLLYRRVIPLLPSAVALAVFVFVSFMTSPAGSDAVDTALIATINSAIIFVCVFCSSEHSAIPSATAGRVAWGVLCGSVAAVITRYTSYEGAYAAAVLASAVTVPLFRMLKKAAAAAPAEVSEPAETESVADDPLPAESADQASPAEDTDIPSPARKDPVMTESEDGEISIEVDKLIDSISAEIGLDSDN